MPPPPQQFARAKQIQRPIKRPIEHEQRNNDDDDDDPLNATQNLVHPEWETRDPTPDIQSLFRAFDTRFFQQKLRCVTLEWSRRMYQCAGICYYRRNYSGTSITIRLSEPLLKLRQRKDLIETLLHEMIHAYLFVLNVREGNGGHGPNFKRLMVSINKTAGTNISVYHTFHEEVNVYRSHVWKCNGICQHRPPFNGVVKRTCNRAPGPNDLWWAQHQQTCGGYFKKISEPEKKTAQKGRSANGATKTTGRIKTIPGLDDANDVRSQRIDDPKWGLAKPAAAASAVRTLTNVGAPQAGFATGGESVRHERIHSVGGNLRNVVGFADLTGTAVKPRILSLGSGNTLGGSSSSSSNSEPGTNNNGTAQPAVIDLVRDIWSKKFDGSTAAPKKTDSGYSGEMKLGFSTSRFVV